MSLPPVKTSEIPVITEQEWKILKEKPIAGVRIIETKYSNKINVITALNKYIEDNNLKEIKDQCGYSVIEPIPIFHTDNEYMMQAILNDDVKLFESIFTHEVQKIMLEPLDFCKYVLHTMEDCINHDAISCLRHAMSNDYTKNRLIYSWLPNATISGYWFKSIARFPVTVNTVFVDSGVLDRMDPLDRNIVYYMITDSAVRCCNTVVFKWCIDTYWKETNRVFKEYGTEPFLNMDNLAAFFELTGNG